MPVFEILLVRGVMVLSISYMKAVTSTQHTFPYALGQRYLLHPSMLSAVLPNQCVVDDLFDSYLGHFCIESAFGTVEQIGGHMQ